MLSVKRFKIKMVQLNDLEIVNVPVLKPAVASAL